MFYNLKHNLISFLTVFILSSSELPTPFSTVNYSVKLEINDEINYRPVPFTIKDFVGFKNFLGFFESGSDYNKVNRFGYLGKYQFGKGTLNMYGVRNLINFKKNPMLQEKIFLMNVKRNKWILRREILKYSNTHMGNFYITESGIIAAAHLSGPGNVKKYLRNMCHESFNKKDANGTSISDYMKIFKGFDLKNIEMNRKPKLEKQNY